jgi:hypothetical protein
MEVQYFNGVLLPVNAGKIQANPIKPVCSIGKQALFLIR